MKTPIFISYSSQNEKEARQVCEFLEKRGVPCWIAPRDVGAGREYAAAIVDAINDCLAMVLVFSSHANTSSQVKREVDRAVSKGKVIIPVKIEDVLPSEAMEFYICNTHWLNACDPPLEAHLESLFRDISSFLGALGKMAPARRRKPAGDDMENAPSPEAESPARRSVGEGGSPGTEAREEGPRVRLDHLDGDCRRVIESARNLASRCHSPEITHRLLMAAFLSESEGVASRLCRAAGADPGLLCALLLALSHQDDTESESENRPDLSLTLEASERILLPALERANEIAANPLAIGERELFHAFCEVANPAFVQFLKSPVPDEAVELVEVDLAELGRIDLEEPGLLHGLSLRARQVVTRAHQLARLRHVTPIPNRLLLAAFLLDPDRLAHRMLASAGLSAATLCDVLIASASGTTDPGATIDEGACARIVSPTLRAARRLAGTGRVVTERILFRAFRQVTDPRLKANLKSIGIDLDSLAEDESSSGSGPDPDPPLPPSNPDRLNWN